MKNRYGKILGRAAGFLTLAAMLVAYAGTARAAILFQDDTYNDVMSDAIRIGSNDAGAVNTAVQFGNNATMSNNGVLTWNIGTNKFSFDHSVDITGGLSATGNVDLHGATQVRIRESATPATAACSNAGELIMNTTTNKVMVCTATGTPGTWANDASTDASTLGGLSSSQFLRSDTSSSLTSGTLTTNSGTTLTVNGALNAGGATRMAVPSGASDPGTCTKGDVFFNSTANTLKTCTATNTWTVAGPQDFEAVYGYDADKTLTTSNGNFTVAPGSGTFTVNGTGALNFNGSSFGLTTTGAFNMNGVGASGINTTSGNLGLATITSGNVNVTSAGAVNLTSTGANDIAMVSGQKITFKDAQLTSAINLTNSATGIASAFGTNGLVDALNTLTGTTLGTGAAEVGLQAGSLTNVTPSANNVQAALVALDAKVGSGAANYSNLTFDPEYPDTVIYQDGSNNQGTLQSDYDSGNALNYYQWSSTQGALQDIDLRFRYLLPTDFASTGTFGFNYRTQDGVNTDNKVDVTVKDITDSATCGSSTANANTSWTIASISAATLNTGCAGLSAGDTLEVDAKLYSLKSGGVEHWSQVGRITQAYNN